MIDAFLCKVCFPVSLDPVYNSRRKLFKVRACYTYLRKNSKELK